MGHQAMISIVVPCFNEEKTIPLLRDAMGQVVTTLAHSHDVETLFL